MLEKDAWVKLLKIQKKIINENIKRMLFTSVLMIVLIPAAMLFYSFQPAKTEKGFSIQLLFIGTEVIAIVFFILALVLRKRAGLGKKILYRSFWGFYLLAFLALVYYNILNTLSFTSYFVLLSVFILVPFFSVAEQVYYIVIQAAIVSAMCLKFSVQANMIVEIVFYHCILIGFSRYVVHLQEEKYVLLEKLRSIKIGADLDSLTGLYNRKGFESKIVSLWASSVSKRSMVAALLVDIDYFKQYNGEFGAQQGNECIKTIASIIKRVSLRKTDGVARLDGGMFLVFLETDDPNEPVVLAEKIRMAIETRSITQSKSVVFPYITVSIGLAAISPKGTGGTGFPGLYDQADIALIYAKECGRNLTADGDKIYGRETQKETYVPVSQF